MSWQATVSCFSFYWDWKAYLEIAKCHYLHTQVSSQLAFLLGR